MTARVLAGLVGLILLGGERVASAQPTQVLHEFTGYVFAEGATAPLILATDGNLYGTTKQTGDLAAWLMSGASVKQSEVVAPHVPLTWQID